jgi:hypothetical protein
MMPRRGIEPRRPELQSGALPSELSRRENPREELNLRRRVRNPRHIRYTTRVQKRRARIELAIRGLEGRAPRPAAGVQW